MVQYGKFVLDDLFSITGTKSTDAGKVSFVKNGDAQFVGRTSAGYGIQGMVNSADMGFDPNEANTISVSQVGTIVAQYRDFPYYTSQNITKFSADFLNPEVGLYFCGIINDWLGKAGFVGYHTVKQRDLKKQVVLLPVTPAGDPDFEYMTMRIRELEAERIRELEAYLRVTGLDDTTLSASEAQALTQKVQWKKFRIGDVFEIRNTASIMKSQVSFGSGNTPYLTAQSSDNGVQTYIDSTDLPLEPAPSIMIGGKTFVLSYQSEPFVSNDSHNLTLRLKDEYQDSANELTYLFLITTIRAFGDERFTWGNAVTKKRLVNGEFLLPVTSDGDIDFDYMQTYIRALEKQTIKGVVECKDKVIQETKKVVNG